MARIKIELPARKVAQLNIPVRITDINYGNHLGHDSLVGILHEARVQWFRMLGFSELDVYGSSLIMSELAVQFKSESFYGDTLQIGIYLGEVSRVSLEIFYRVAVPRKDHFDEVGLAKTGMVCYDYQAGKVTSLPMRLKEQLEGLPVMH
ncbi:MAG: thioesterase family protein [Bacteroidota bacterium]|nr:thioesterase family protein [Bacteroidota bacterium]